MAITSSAKKAIRVAARKAVFNARHKKAIDLVAKKIRKFIAAGNQSEAKALLPKAYKEIDKAAKVNFLKRNTADRMKSRLTLFVNKTVAKAK